MSNRPMLCFALVCGALAIAVSAQEMTGLPQRFTATAVSLGGPMSAAGTDRVDIIIERWSTPQERTELLTAVKGASAQELLEKLRAQKSVGRISTTGNVGHELRYASEQPDNEHGGRRIFIATDRPVDLWEEFNRSNLSQYPFTFVELRLDDKGHGEGRLALATQLSVAGNVIELVNYTLQPLALTEVRQELK